MIDTADAVNHLSHLHQIRHRCDKQERLPGIAEQSVRLTRDCRGAVAGRVGGAESAADLIRAGLVTVEDSVDINRETAVLLSSRQRALKDDRLAARRR